MPITAGMAHDVQMNPSHQSEWSVTRTHLQKPQMTEFSIRSAIKRLAGDVPKKQLLFPYSTTVSSGLGLQTSDDLQ